MCRQTWLWALLLVAVGSQIGLQPAWAGRRRQCCESSPAAVQAKRQAGPAATAAETNNLPSASAAAVVKDWIDKSDLVSSRSPEKIRDWWHILGDPTLDALVANVSQQHLTLREAAFRVLAARASRAIAALELVPQRQDITVKNQEIATRSAAANSQFLREPNDQLDLSFRLAWELDFWRRCCRALESDDADLDVSVENYDQALVTLIGDVAATYVEVRTIQQQQVSVEANVGLQREAHNIAHARFRSGHGSSSDVDQAAKNLTQTEALLSQLEGQFRMASNRLSILLGMAWQELSQRLGEGPIPWALPEIAVGLPADLLTRRSDVRRAERLVARQCEVVGVAMSELDPQLGVAGTLGSSGNRADLLAKQALQRRMLNEIRSRDARLAELIVAYQNTVLNAHAEAEDGLAKYFAAQQATRVWVASVDASKKAAHVALVQYRAGSVAFDRVSSIQKNLVAQQNQLAESQGSIVQSLVQVYRSLGGGWQIQPNGQQGAAPQAAPTSAGARPGK